MIMHLTIGSYVFCLLLVIFQYGKDASRAIPYLISAKFLQGTGSLLLEAMGPGPEFSTVLTANGVLLAGCAYEAWAVLHITGRQVGRSVRLAVTSGIFAACAATYFLTPERKTAAVFLLHTLFYVVPAAALLGGNSSRSPLRYALGCGFALLTALFFWLGASLLVPNQLSQLDLRAALRDIVQPAVYCMMLASGFSMVLLSREKGDAELMVAQQRLEESNTKLAALNRTDWLTGIANRRHFEQVLAQEYARHIRTGAWLSLLILDIDHFKEFNDRYGHIPGDECLQRIGKVLSGCATRAGDLAARYGGEEFACILPATSAEGAADIAGEILHGIRNLAIPHEGSPTDDRVTASIGVATVRCTKGGSQLDLLARADSLLYKAKSNGRNRIELDEPDAA